MVLDKQTIIAISMAVIILALIGIYIYLRKKTKKLKKRKLNTIGKKILYWLPRVLSILFTMLISLLALDVFTEPFFENALEILIGLFMHLIPSFILILIILIAWKWEHIGGTIFIIIGLLFVLMMGVERDLSFLVIPGILIFFGILFWLNHLLLPK